ncbi:MAG: family 43 glycosylhydrolase [Spirochaetes bacterium]|nr:family 43 glycosylhydrolase [Spirochaetota bacterium]
MRIKDFMQLTFKEYEGNPIIAPPFPSPIIADPTFVPPNQSPDGRWHLFAHSLMGIHHFISEDGLYYVKRSGAIRNAMRPYIFYENNTYYLYYEKIKPFILWYSWLPHRWYSYIAMRTSKDLQTWSDEKTILTPSLSWHSNQYGHSISNPCIVNHKQSYFLYYSAALTYIHDCGFNEPLYIGLAKAYSPTGPFESLPQPIMEPSKYNRWCNIGCGSFKVVTMDDGFIGLQNGIYWDYTINHSGSAILLYSSKDGIHFTPISNEPLLKPDIQQGSFKRSHVYAFDIKQVNSNWYLYFNARNNWHWTKGKEHIGLLIGSKKS